jgi:hypothetical protein
MPAYQNNPFQRPVLVTKGVPCYLFGTYDFKVGNTRAALTNSALTSNVATVTVQIIEGPLPVVGGLISIVNSTAGSAVLNVNRAVITGVNINTTTNAGTITFALTNANITSVADAGTVVVEPAEVAETLVAGASIPCVIQAPEGDSQFTVPFAVTFPTIPTAATVTLQRAISVATVISEWTNTAAVVTVAASAYTTGPVVLATLERGYAYRAFVSGITGTGQIVCKVGG